MTEDNSQTDPYAGLRRYVPLVSWAIVFLALLFIPLKVIQYGYLPGDDALRHAASPPKWQNILWMTPLIAIAIFLHGMWYIWALTIASFFLAQQFRWCWLMGISWVLGTLLGSAFTGHPVDSIAQVIQLAIRA